MVNFMNYLVSIGLNDTYINTQAVKVKVYNVFYCQKPFSGKSTTTECGVNYMFLIKDK